MGQQPIIQGTTGLLGVIGSPVEHSLSPAMHNAALAALGLDLVYLPFAIAPPDLKTAIAGFTAMGLTGFNVTIPHKQAILPLLSDVSEVAQAVGAVNTVWRTAAGWAGTNTDVTGFLLPLQHRDWTGQAALILGNGGAARAVVAACAQLGFDRIRVAGRSAQKLAAFSESWQAAVFCRQVSVHPLDQIDDYLPKTQLVVNTTPLGMAPAVGASPLTAEQFGQVPAGAIAYDLIYTPSPTRFLQLAAAAGLETLDGLEMLVQQGAAALELWIGQPPPVEVMRSALLAQCKLKKS